MPSKAANVRRWTVTLGDTLGERCIGSGLAISVGLRVGDHFVRVGHPDRAKSLEVQPEVIAPQRRSQEPSISRHDRFPHDVAGIVQVGDMPFVGILAADPRQIRSGSLGAPKHGVVVFGFDRKRVGAVTLDLIAQSADHLRVTGVAAFADVDVASREFERRIDAHVGRIFHGLRMVNNGAISTMPPMLATPIIASTRPIALRSSR